MSDGGGSDGRQPARSAVRPTIRLDKWLWQARFLRTRAAATALVAEGHLRLNGEPTRKPHRAVGAGDVLTFALGARVRVVRILAPGDRRGPAPEAQALYEDLAPLEARAPGGYLAPDPGTEHGESA